MSDNTEQANLGQPEEANLVAIIINTRTRKVPPPSITFDALVALYDGPPLTGPNVEWTITYRRGTASNPEGNLYAGQTVPIQKGMIFNVTPTDKS